MILALLISIVVTTLELLVGLPVQFLNGLLPFSITVDTLPFGVDEHMVNGVGYFNYIATFFPPFAVLKTTILWVIGFKVALKIISMIPFVRHLVKNV